MYINGIYIFLHDTDLSLLRSVKIVVSHTHTGWSVNRYRCGYGCGCGCGNQLQGAEDTECGRVMPIIVAWCRRS